MAWVVDTSVLLDVQGKDPVFGMASARCLSQHLSEGLVLCPVSYVELAPVFRGDPRAQQKFLQQVGVHWSESWHWRDTQAAHGLWTVYVAAKRAGASKKRVVADLLIEAFAQRFQGIITRNPRDFPTVPTVVPEGMGKLPIGP